MVADLKGSTPFADDGSTVIEKELQIRSNLSVVGTLSALSLDSEDLQNRITDFYEISRTAQWILSNDFEKVALQFPDELLADSTIVCRLLIKETGKKVYILADTSYGSCCVDEVAAQHVDADCIIHYGTSCLSPTSRLPVLYVFGKLEIDVDNAVSSFESLFPEKDAHVIFMYDVMYSHSISEIEKRLTALAYTDVIISSVDNQNSISKPIKIGDTKSCGSESTPDSDCPSSSCCAKEASCVSATISQSPAVPAVAESNDTSGRQYSIPTGRDISEYSIFYIGQEGLSLNNIMMTHSQCKVYSYNPSTRVARQETLQVNKALMRRYFLVQKAKDADVIGIVVGTLGVSSYLNIISHLKSLIRDSGKKYYTFVMGKLNVAKLANFMEIDIYVLVACPETSLIDSKEFYRPVVTPFELEIALSSSKSWTGEYITDFRQLLPQLSGEPEISEKLQTTHIEEGSCQSTQEDKEDSENSEDDDETPYFSLVTGKLMSKTKFTPSESNFQTSTQLTTTASSNKQLSTNVMSPAARYLASRSYQGLDISSIGETEVMKAVDGREGIARGYKNEPKEDESGR